MLPEPTVSIIIPVRIDGANGSTAFRACQTSLSALTPAPGEIIVVLDGAPADDAPADGDSDNWRHLAEHLGARVLTLSTCGGPARARNHGAQNACGDILFFVDADVAVHSNAISQIMATFRREPDVVAIIGSYDDEPGAANFLSQYKNLLHHYVHQTAQLEASTFWGACGAIRREVFLASGGFDDSYRQPSIEDIELGYRLRRAGHKIRLCKELQVKHLKQWGVLSLLKADFFYRALPWTALILRDRRFINDLNLQLSSRICVALSWGLVGLVIGAGWWPLLLAPVGLIMLALILLNAPLYRFFFEKRGLVFTIRVIPWHWLYYWYSGMAFAVGSLRHLLSGIRGALPGK